MSAIVVSVFAGERPRVADRLLDTQNAVVAVNCTLERGSLRPLPARRNRRLWTRFPVRYSSMTRMVGFPGLTELTW